MQRGHWSRIWIILALALPLFALGCAVEGSRTVKESTQPGSNASFGVTGIVEYTVQASDGTVLEHGVIHNAVNNEALDEAFSRLIVDAIGLTMGYDAIVALSVDSSLDDPSDGVDAASLTLLLDGNGGQPGDQNPADGSVAPPSDGSGQGTISVTFTAQDAAEVKQIVLTKAAEDNTITDGGAEPVADADILSYVDVPDISLNSGDSVTYVWTINVD